VLEGRKRHLLVDTLGLVLGVAVTPDSVPERDGGQVGLEPGAALLALAPPTVDGR